MGIHSDWGRYIQRWKRSQPQREYINSNCISKYSNINCRSSSDRNSNKFLRLPRLFKFSNLYNNKSRRGVSIRTNIPRTRYDESDRDPKSYDYKKRNRHNKYVYPVIATGLVLNSLLPIKALAEGVGGVSATANPIANSSGSVTNQAIQVLQGPYITNTYGGGVQCQGATFNLTPYVQFADSRKDPWEDFYNEPQYDMTDFIGRTTQQTISVKNYPWETWYDTRTKADGSRWFEDGADMDITVDVDGPDGKPDNPGDVVWHKPVRTDMRANQSLNLGLSATLSIPLNRKLQKQCYAAANAQIAMSEQLTANKRLDFEIARLKNCGELKKSGIFFHPASPYHSVCADVVVTAPGGQVIPHQHQMPELQFNDPSTRSSSSVSSVVEVPSSHDNGLSTLQIGTVSEESSQESSEPSQ